MVARRTVGGPGHGLVRVRRVGRERHEVDGDAVAPPELPRDAPVAAVLEPRVPRALVHGGHDVQLVRTHRLHRLRRHRLAVHVPAISNASTVCLKSILQSTLHNSNVLIMYGYGREYH